MSELDEVLALVVKARAQGILIRRAAFGSTVVEVASVVGIDEPERATPEPAPDDPLGGLVPGPVRAAIERESRRHEAQVEE